MSEPGAPRSAPAVAAVPAKNVAVAAVAPGVLDRFARPVRTAVLPVWPLVVMFALTPLWWVTGTWFFVWPFFGLLLFTLLATRGGLYLPAGVAPWLIFLGLVVISATQLERVAGLFIFTLRLGHLFTAFMVGVYVYNVTRHRVGWARVCAPLCVFWLVLVALGWLGVLAPTFSAPSLFELVLPDRIAGERYVVDITHLDSTEFNKFSRNPIYRPAAPFPYTNNWGTAYAFLVPFVLSYLTAVRRGVLRWALLVSLPLSIVPAFYTLNRGMFIGLGLGVAYLVLRDLVRGRVRLVLPVLGLGLLGWVFTWFIPVATLIEDRTSTTDTTRDRFDLYRQTWEAVLHSPLLGYGQPTSVDTTHAAEPLGTQGMLWQMLFSHGIPATIAFYVIFAVVARRMAAAVSPTGLWLCTLPVIAVVMTPFYGYDDPNMSVLWYGIGLGLAAVDGPVARESG